MKLLDRMSTLLKADAHGVIESLEERSLLLKQYLREAELEVDRKRAAVEALRDDDKHLRERHARAEQECRALDEDVSLALAGGKEDPARFAVRRLLPRRKEAAALAAEVEKRAAEIHALAERLTPDGRWLLWAPSSTALPAGLRILGEVPLGGRERRLVVAAP